MKLRFADDDFAVEPSITSDSLSSLLPSIHRSIPLSKQADSAQNAVSQNLFRVVQK